MPTHSNMNQSKEMANIPADQRPSGADPERGAEPGERKKEGNEITPGEVSSGPEREQQQQGGGKSSPA